MYKSLLACGEARYRGLCLCSRARGCCVPPPFPPSHTHTPSDGEGRIRFRLFVCSAPRLPALQASSEVLFRSDSMGICHLNGTTQCPNLNIRKNCGSPLSIIFPDGSLIIFPDVNSPDFCHRNDVGAHCDSGPLPSQRSNMGKLRYRSLGRSGHIEIQPRCLLGFRPKHACLASVLYEGHMAVV